MSIKLKHLMAAPLPSASHVLSVSCLIIICMYAGWKTVYTIHYAILDRFEVEDAASPSEMGYCRFKEGERLRSPSLRCRTHRR
jgi:hypothetical protein